MSKWTPLHPSFGMAALTAVVWYGGSGIAFGETIDRSPRKAILLNDSKRFIVQDAWNCVALYQLGEVMPIHRFPTPGWVENLAVTSDEKRLLVACSNGSLGVWEVETGTRVWEQTGLGYIFDVSFAHNGESCIVCDAKGNAIILKTTTGERLGIVRISPKQLSILSGALSPDGTKGVLIDFGERLYTFDVATGTLMDSKLTGGGPVRYSVDGKYVAIRSNNSGVSEQLRVVGMDGTFSKRDFGTFSHIGHISPSPEGGFLVCGRIEGKHDEAAVIIGLRVQPSVEGVQEIWKQPLWRWPNSGGVEERWKPLVWTGIDIKTDFLPVSMIGVSTEFRLITQVIDLRTGALLQQVDNSMNYRPILVTYTSTAIVQWLLGSWLGLAIIIAVLLGVATVITFWLKAKHRKRASATVTQV
jgi:hypothetical protein